MMSQNSQLKGTSARHLDRHRGVAIEPKQVEARDAGEGERGSFAGRREHALLDGARGLERGEEQVEPALGLALEQVGRLGKLGGAGGGRGTPDHGGLSELLGAVEHLAHGRGLDQHSRDHHRVGPAEGLFGERAEVQIVEL